jgi:hypothetical protein
VGLFWLCYRVEGIFSGLVLLDANSRADACLRAELENLNPGGNCDCYEIGAEEAQQIPGRFIGVLLGNEGVAELERIIVKHTPKKPPASSVLDETEVPESRQAG